MKKILLFAYLCVSLAVMRNGGFRADSIFPPSTHCTQKDAVRTTAVRQVLAHFYCGVSGSDQAQIIELIGHALDAMPAGALPDAQVYAFADLDQGVAAEHGFLQSEGYDISAGQLQLAWLNNDYLGQTFRGAVFLYVGNSSWRRDPLLPPLTVLHEMHHLLQYQLLDSNRRVPLWLLEGGADEFALLELSKLGLPAPSRSFSSYRCDYPLADLEDEHEAVPLACAYVHGAQAVQLLLGQRGNQAYYQLFRNLGGSTSFAASFSRAYDFPLTDLYRAFHARQDSGSTVPPRFAVPLASP